MSISKQQHPRLLGELKLCTEVGPFLGDTRIRLLEAIDRLGSLSQAAKSLPLSYRAAWDALDDMNNLAESPLVIRTTGGKHGGGTQLTPYGRQTVALYRAMEAEYQQTLSRLQTAMPEPLAEDGSAIKEAREFRRLIRRLSMKSSARSPAWATRAAERPCSSHSRGARPRASTRAAAVGKVSPAAGNSHCQPAREPATSMPLTTGLSR